MCAWLHRGQPYAQTCFGLMWEVRNLAFFESIALLNQPNRWKMSIICARWKRYQGKLSAATRQRSELKNVGSVRVRLSPLVDTSVTSPSREASFQHPSPVGGYVLKRFPLYHRCHAFIHHFDGSRSPGSLCWATERPPPAPRSSHINVSVAHNYCFRAT